MATVEELGQRVKAKHPGAYDDIPDADLGRKVKAKFPGAYDDFVDAPKSTVGETVVRHGLQGLTANHADEIKGFSDWIAAGVRAGNPELGNDDIPGPAPDPQAYQKGRDEWRARDAVTAKENPKAAILANLGGMVVSDTALGMMGVPPMALAAGGGALAGEGASNSDDPRNWAVDSGIGAVSGALGYLGGTALAKAAGKGKAWALGKVRGGESRAAAQATEEVTDAIGSLKGQYGKSKEVANRIIENLIREEQAGTLTPANTALLASLKKSPEWSDIVNTIVANNLADAPATVADQAAKKAAYQAAQAAKPATIAARTSELSKPQVGADVRTYLKAYAEPAAWALGANQVGDALGLDPETNLALTAGAGILGGRTRAGKALYSRITRPGNQIAWGNRAASALGTVQNAAPWAGAGIGQALRPVVAGSGLASSAHAAVSPVPSPKQLAQRDPVVGEAYQKGGSLSAAATFYSEAQKRPDEILSWLNEGRLP